VRTSRRTHYSTVGAAQLHDPNHKGNNGTIMHIQITNFTTSPPASCGWELDLRRSLFQQRIRSSQTARGHRILLHSRTITATGEHWTLCITYGWRSNFDCSRQGHTTPSRSMLPSHEYTHEAAASPIHYRRSCTCFRVKPVRTLALAFPCEYSCLGFQPSVRLPASRPKQYKPCASTSHTSSYGHRVSATTRSYPFSSGEVTRSHVVFGNGVSWLWDISLPIRCSSRDSQYVESLSGQTNTS
jgi:hypothetical protein